VAESPIIRKVRALLAKARGTENEAEATLFAAKAAAMLQEHNLTESELGTAESKEDLIQLHCPSVDTNPWRMDVYGGLAHLYFGSIYITSYVDKALKLRRAIVIVARPHNAEIIKSMAEYLVATTLRLAKEYSPHRRDRLQFEKACGHRIAARLRDMAKAAEAPQLTSGGSNLPALYKTELQLVNDKVEAITGGKTARGSTRLTGSAAERAGRSAGNSVNLGQQLGGGTSQPRLGAR
jgi:hypothetical protein